MSDPTGKPKHHDAGKLTKHVIASKSPRLPYPQNVSLKLSASCRKKDAESGLSPWAFLSGNAKIPRTDLN